MSTFETAKAMQPKLIADRRHFHAHPELNFAEHETSRYASEQLKEMGFAIKQLGGQTGIVADFGVGPITIAIRCDMDAMPLTELNRTPYTSQNPGVMHACGHDAHLACTLGAARIITQQKPAARIRIIIQPGDDADEKLGATTMIEAGALDGVDILLGMHVDATLATGKVGIVSGATMALNQRFTVSASTDNESSGESSGESNSESALTIAKIACRLAELPMLTGMQGTSATPGIPSDNSAPAISNTATPISSSATPISSSATATASSAFKGSSIAIDAINAGMVGLSQQIDGMKNANIAGTLKTPDRDIQKTLQEKIVQLVKDFDKDALIKFEPCAEQKASSAAVSTVLHNAAVDLIGKENVLSIKRKSWNFQFTLYTEHVAGAMIYLGAELPNSRRIHQTNTFEIDENCLPIGTAILAEAALRLSSGMS